MQNQIFFCAALCFMKQLHSPISEHFVCNKANGRIIKRWLQENKAHQIFRKTNISYPLIRTRTCAHQEVRNFSFSKNLTSFLFLQQPC